MAENDKQTTECLSSTEEETRDSSERETSAKDTESESTSSPQSSDPTVEEILSTPTDESLNAVREVGFFSGVGSQVAQSKSGKAVATSPSSGFGTKVGSTRPGCRSSPSAKSYTVDGYLVKLVNSSTDETREILRQRVLLRLRQLDFNRNRNLRNPLPSESDGRESGVGTRSFTPQDSSGFGLRKQQMDEMMSSQSSSKSDESPSVPDNPTSPAEMPEDGTTVEQLDEMMSKFLIEICPRSSEDALAAVNLSEPKVSQGSSAPSQTGETSKQRKTRAFRSLVTTLCRSKQPQMNQMAELCSRYSSSSSDDAIRPQQDVEMLSDDESGRKPRARTVSERSKEQTPKRQIGGDGGPSSSDDGTSSPKKKLTTGGNNPVAVGAEDCKKDSGEADDETDSPNPMETEKFFDYVVDEEEDKMC